MTIFSTLLCIQIKDERWTKKHVDRNSLPSKSGVKFWVDKLLQKADWPPRRLNACSNPATIERYLVFVLDKITMQSNHIGVLIKRHWEEFEVVIKESWAPLDQTHSGCHQCRRPSSSPSSNICRASPRALNRYMQGEASRTDPAQCPCRIQQPSMLIWAGRREH